jgi:CRP-like cAMP-binding protein
MPDREIIAKLKKAFLFQDLPESMLTALALKITKHHLQPGQALFRKGDAGDALYIIDDGWLKIVTEDAQGGELVLNRCGPGEMIGEMSLLDEEPRSAGVVALKDADVLELRRDEFLDVLNQRPDLAISVIRDVSSRLRFATIYIEKAIQWSHRIAEGDYSFADQVKAESEGAVSNEDKAGELLSAFFQLVQGVKGREDELKQQLQKLTLEIDEVRRKQEFEELTGTDFYANLKAQAAKLRQQRLDNQ